MASLCTGSSVLPSPRDAAQVGGSDREPLMATTRDGRPHSGRARESTEVGQHKFTISTQFVIASICE